MKEATPWYRWLLVPLALPAALVILVPMSILAAFSIPYYAVFPHHHPHSADFGTPRQRDLIRGWRARYARLSLWAKLRRAVTRKRHRAVVRSFDMKPTTH